MPTPIHVVNASPPPVREIRTRAERRRLVEEAATELFALRGYEGATFEGIATRMGMRGAALRYYYTSKERLFLDVVERTTQEVLRRLRLIAQAYDPPDEQLRGLFVEQALIEARDSPAWAPLLSLPVPDPRMAERMAELRSVHRSVFLAPAHRLALDGGTPVERANIAVLLHLGSISQLHRWYDPNGPLSLEDLAGQAAGNLLRSLRGDASH